MTTATGHRYIVNDAQILGGEPIILALARRFGRLSRLGGWAYPQKRFPAPCRI